MRLDPLHFLRLPLVRQLVICDSCAKGYHQLCAEPNVQEEVVTSDISWYCKACDIKIAQSRPAVDVTTGDWSNSDSYSAEQKREWLENLPLHSLVNYVTSIEKSELSMFTGIRPCTDIYAYRIRSTTRDVRSRYLASCAPHSAGRCTRSSGGRSGGAQAEGRSGGG